MTPSLGPVTARAHSILAPNPGPMTLDGTNTWVLLEPGAGSAVVVDPGPADEDHLRAVVEHVEQRDASVGLVLVTHRHLDHTEGVSRFAELTGAPVLAPSAGELRGGQRIEHDGLEVEVVATPGHTSDSVSFVLPADRALLTGDTILGRGTTVVAWPDGALTPYLDTLTALLRLVEAGSVHTILPGHGPVVADPGGWLRWYVEHRHERLDQVRGALAQGARTALEVVETVYSDVPRALWGAAEQSVRAQLEYLRHPN